MVRQSVDHKGHQQTESVFAMRLGTCVSWFLVPDIISEFHFKEHKRFHKLNTLIDCKNNV